MVDINKELYKFFKETIPILSQLLNGIILRDKPVCKAGNTSAVIFVPKYLLGQRVKVIIVPEDTEVAGLRRTIDKKQKKISKLTKEVTNLKTQEAEKVDEKIEETDPETIKIDEESY